MIDQYLNTYIDRRMKNIIEEWQLATRHDLTTFRKRLDTLTDEATRLAGVEEKADARLASLEERAKKLEEKEK
jgi:polyhydroxyalkanoate synthesis regulator phasin